MDLTTISVAAAAVVAVCGAILQVFGVLGKVGAGIAWLWHKLVPWRPKAAGLDLPTRTVVIVPQSRINALWWSNGKFGERKVLQVCGDFHATNAWTKDVRFTGAVLRTGRWGINRQETMGEASVKDLRSQYSGPYPIPPNATTWLRVHFMNVPDDGRPPGTLIADLAVIDQFNNYHWVKRLHFKHPDTMLG